MPNPDRSKIKEKVRQLPHAPGVYLMKDRLGRVIYVGKAKDLKKRVSTYFQASRRFTNQQPKVRAMIDLIHDFDTVDVRSEPEALLLEGRLIKQYKPRYNTDFTDDKRFLLVRVETGVELPRFRLVRFAKDDQARYFGPFAHAGLLRKTLQEMRRRFGILLGDARPQRRGDGLWQLYDDVRREIYEHENVVTVEEYADRVEQACVFLDGKSREWLVELKAEMVQAAQDREFERAAELRDVVYALDRTIQKTRKFVRDPTRFAATHHEAALERLRDALALSGLPERMECFDISHISGTFVVASMVHFSGGKPHKAQYRRFRIKGFVGNDDFRAMEEVVGRRYRRLRDEGRAFPDLVVIDGGAGQVGAAMKAFATHGIDPPPLVGLAKREETVVFPDDRDPLRLPAHDAGLRLLQRIRDEAHRFANTFNAELRSRRMKETILDDFMGMGPVRRKALMDHFRTLDRVRAASVEGLQAVPGIGPKMAADLHAYLRRTSLEAELSV